MPFMSLIHPDDHGATLAVWQALLQGQPALRFENRYRDKCGGWHWLQWVAVPENGKIYCSARDISEEKDAAQALRAAQESLDHSVSALLQSQKLEALGKLTGGVAHDFNNVLQIISGNLQLLQITMGSDPQAAKRIASSSAAVERGAKLSAQLLAFARRQPLKPLVTDLKALLRSTEDLLRRAVGETVDTQVHDRRRRLAGAGRPEPAGKRDPEPGHQCARRDGWPWQADGVAVQLSRSTGARRPGGRRSMCSWPSATPAAASRPS